VRISRALSVLGGLLLSSLLGFSADAARSKAPQLTLRVSPLLGPPTTEFLFVGELKGGAETEELYCPTLEWRWGVQEISLQEPECPPFQAGVTRIERRFSFTRRFSEGTRVAALVLHKGNKVLARASVSFSVSSDKPLKGTYARPD